VLFAYTNPTASQITVTSLNNAGATSAVNLTGTLTLQ
jgi:trimethylamine:corrinoid methyltransferase-like protein